MSASRKMAPKAMMMSEEELYADTEEGSSMTIAKDALPGEFPVGTHLILAEDMGDSFRVEIMEEPSPEPGESDEYS